MQIYWSDIGIGAISMAYLNGSQQEVVFAHSQIGTSFMACVIVRITLNIMTKKGGGGDYMKCIHSTVHELYSTTVKKKARPHP